MKNFEYTAPRSVEEATRKLGEYSQPVLLAGGTDLLVQLRTQRKTADAVIDLKLIQELNEVTDDPARGLTLGRRFPVIAFMTMQASAEDTRRWRKWPV